MPSYPYNDPELDCGRYSTIISIIISYIKLCKGNIFGQEIEKLSEVFYFSNPLVLMCCSSPELALAASLR